MVAFSSDGGSCTHKGVGHFAKGLVGVWVCGRHCGVCVPQSLLSVFSLQLDDAKNLCRRRRRRLCAVWWPSTFNFIGIVSQTYRPAPLLLSVCLPVCVVCARVLVILRLTFSLNPKPPPTPLHTPLSICCLPCATLKMAAFSRERWKARSECWWDRLSMCVCLGACMRAYLSSCPIQFLGLPHWAFPCPVWKPRFCVSTYS